ncbi:tryptophan synthase subunit alpha [Sulfurimonas sp. HSL1-6]|uniref:tryptophan synthase subunit alpha n=1 Tax=Thiomicrolovo immobilis TaxID=3131935 RepID=UPI0031F8926D
MEKQLVGYITTGYPDKDFTIDLALSMGESGVDSLELGIPFSDPVADGPVIEAANYVALENGFRFKDVLDVSRAVAPRVDTLWMGYFNPFYQFGMEKVLREANDLGVSGLIVPDLPHEEAVLYADAFARHRISNIAFVAPTDTDARVKTVVSAAQKFIYLVAYAGITGAGKSEDLGEVVASIRRHTQTPVYVGFGVNEETAKTKAEGVDGVIVGSAFINVLLREDLSLSEKINHCSRIAKTIKERINE